MTGLGLVATLLLKDRTGIPLGPDYEAEQNISPIYGIKSKVHVSTDNLKTVSIE